MTSSDLQHPPHAALRAPGADEGPSCSMMLFAFAQVFYGWRTCRDLVYQVATMAFGACLRGVLAHLAGRLTPEAECRQAAIGEVEVAPPEFRGTELDSM